MIDIIVFLGPSLVYFFREIIHSKAVGSFEVLNICAQLKCTCSYWRIFDAFWRICDAFSGYWLWFAWRRTLLARDSGKRLPAQQLQPLYRSRWQRGWVFLFVYISLLRVLGPTVAAWASLFVCLHFLAKPEVEITIVLGLQWQQGWVFLFVYISLLNQRWKSQ